MSRISYEARKLLREFFDFADELRYKGIYDITEILTGFYNELNPKYDGESRNNLTKRVLKMMKDYVETDPRYQSRIDEFAKVSS